MQANPSARRFVERILGERTAELTNGEEAVAAVRTAHEKLARAMSPIIGEAGLLAMFARSVRKARALYPCLDSVEVSDLDTVLERLWSSLGQQEPAAIREIGIALLSNFVELLATLIGDELTLTLFRNAWPEASALASEEADRS
jgi:hypothetical protein